MSYTNPLFEGLDLEELHYQARSDGFKPTTLNDAENTVLDAFLADVKAYGWYINRTPQVFSTANGCEVVMSKLSAPENIWWSFNDRELLNRLIERGRISLPASTTSKSVASIPDSDTFI